MQQAMIKRMNKFMYCRARNHRVNFGTILDEAMRMVQGLDEQKRRDDYLGDLKVHKWAGGSARYGLRC